MTHRRSELQGMAIVALNARAAGDPRWQQLVHALAQRFGLSHDRVAFEIEVLAMGDRVMAAMARDLKSKAWA